MMEEAGRKISEEDDLRVRRYLNTGVEYLSITVLVR